MSKIGYKPKIMIIYHPGKKLSSKSDSVKERLERADKYSQLEFYEDSPRSEETMVSPFGIHVGEENIGIAVENLTKYILGK